MFLLRTPEGQRVAGTVDLMGTGPAQVRLLSQEGRQRVEATLTNGEVLLADVSLPADDNLALTGRPQDGRPTWVWVTDVSTLVAAYRDAHPEAGERAVTKVRDFLGLGARASLNRPFSSHYYSRFSPRVYREAALGRSPLAFAQSLVGEIDAGQNRRFAEVSPLVRLNLPRGFKTLSGGDSPAPILAKDDPIDYRVWNNIWGGGLCLSLLQKGTGYLLGKTNLVQSTASELRQINNELNQINTQLTQMSSQLNNIQQAAATSTLASSLSPALTNISNYSNNQTQAAQALAPLPTASPQTPIYTPFSTNNAFVSAPAYTSWISSANLASALSDACQILGVALGGNSGNLVTGTVELQTISYGSLPPTNLTPAGAVWPFFYDFRNDVAITPQVVNTTAFYVGAVTGAANMLSESANQDLGQVLVLKEAQIDLNGYTKTQGVGLGLTTNNTLVDNGLAPLTKRLAQQAPLGLLGGESALSSVWGAPADAESNVGTGRLNGTLWTASGFENYASGTGNPNSPGEGTNQPSDVSTGPVDLLPYSVGGYNNWYWPSESEAKQLLKRAESIGNHAKDPHPYAYGLLQLGLLSQQGYNHAAKNHNGRVWIYCSWSVDSKGKPSMQAVASDGSTNNGLNTLVYTYGADLIFRPEYGDTAVALLVRPLPGPPRGSSLGDPGQATQGGAPSAVSGSATAQQLGGNPYMWQSDLALAGNFIPDEVVIQPATPDNPKQLRAYGIWSVALKGASKDYSTDVLISAGTAESGEQLDLGNAYYPTTPFASGYLIYEELTDVAEWLSSDTTQVEVGNAGPPVLSITGGTVSSAAGLATLLNATAAGPLVSNSTTPVTLSGGTVQNALLSTGTLSGGNTLVGPSFAGAIVNPANPLNATLEGGQVTSGSLVVSSANSLVNPQDGTTQVGTLVNGTLSGTTLTGGLLGVAAANSGVGGLLTVHGGPSGSSAVNITASWLASPRTTGNRSPNSVASNPTYVTGTLPVQFPASGAQTGIASIIISPNYVLSQSTSAGNLVFTLTAINNDGTYQDLSLDPNTTWQVFLLTDGTPRPPAPGLGFKTQSGFTNTLVAPVGFGGYVAVKATHFGLSSWAFLNLSFTTTSGGDP